MDTLSMHSKDEKLAFAARLKQALKRSRKKIETPTDLATQFSLKSNTSVTPQAAQKWLMGTAIPTPDKIAILAKWLDVSVKWLRYGVTDEVRPPRPPRRTSVLMGEPEAPSAAEWVLLERLRRMPEARRRLVEDLVEQLVLDWDAWKHP
jgi:transcriptional regulator with XRE-family HTH domain